MPTITSIEQLESIYGTPRETSVRKEVTRLNSGYRELLAASPFFALATTGKEGLDCSPRGDEGSAVRVVDDSTLMIPDRKGNNRMDSLRNIIIDPRVALLFLVPGHDVSLRINGTATISTDEVLLDSFDVRGALPRSVLIVSIEAVYFQCARALMRSRLWDPDSHVAPETIPTCGALLEEITAGDMTAAEYDPLLYSRLKNNLF
jgi:PPOX class probable FMN-dependent enzyme